ncbi:hypothetical protein EON64_01730 [archaeon]|nr:MAG: hypothetical protein EON64_01730 [archaeon]
MERTTEFVFNRNGAMELWRGLDGVESSSYLENIPPSLGKARAALIVPERVTKHYEKLLGHERNRYNTFSAADSVCIQDFTELGGSAARIIKKEKRASTKQRQKTNNFDIRSWKN